MKNPDVRLLRNSSNKKHVAIASTQCLLLADGTGRESEIRDGNVSTVAIKKSKVLSPEVIRAIANLREKFRWADLRDVLREAGLAHGSGWEGLKGKLLDASPEDAAKASKVFDELNRNIVFAGVKEVFVIELTDDDIAAIDSQLTGVEVPAGDYASLFPFPLDANALAGRSSSYELSAKSVRKNGDCQLVLCARRTNEEREKYEYSVVSSEVQKAFRGVDEFITVRRIPYQIFDILTFRPSLKRLEILIDFPDRIRLPEDVFNRLDAILQFTSKFVPRLFNILESKSILNLYPCIEGLYSDKKEGRISKLSCRLPTGPVVRQAMTTDEDLRNEKFHTAGVAAVGKITPNQITVVWDTILNVSGSIELSIAAPISSISTIGAEVKSARLSGIRSDAGVVVAVNKLIKFA